MPTATSRKGYEGRGIGLGEVGLQDRTQPLVVVEGSFPPTLPQAFTLAVTYLLRGQMLTEFISMHW